MLNPHCLLCLVSCHLLSWLKIYASMCRLGTAERKRTLTHRSSSCTIAPPPPFSSFAVSLSLPMTSLVSYRLGMGELLVRNVNDYGNDRILFLKHMFFFSKAQPSPALDPRECLEGCSTPTAGSCPPSGWSFTFFHSCCYQLVPQIDQESTRYRKIMCLADSDIVH